MISITSTELNYLIFRYLNESGKFLSCACYLLVGGWQICASISGSVLELETEFLK